MNINANAEPQRHANKAAMIIAMNTNTMMMTIINWLISLSALPHGISTKNA